MNEVIAHLAAARLGEGRSVHPNDHVNRCQSSNDTIPTALQLQRGDGHRGGADPGPRRTADGARGEGGRVLAGRQDRAHPPPGRDPDPARPGVPRLCGTGRGSDPAMPGRPRRTARRSRSGGTAVGTGINAHPEYAAPRLRAPDRAPDAARPRGPEPLPRPGHPRRRRSPRTARSARPPSASGRSPRTSG